MGLTTNPTDIVLFPFKYAISYAQLRQRGVGCNRNECMVCSQKQEAKQPLSPVWHRDNTTQRKGVELGNRTVVCMVNVEFLQQ